MNGAAVAHGLRAILPAYTGTVMHGAVVEALDLLARCAPELQRLNDAVPYVERTGSDGTEAGDDVAQAVAFAAGWRGHPNAGPPDVLPASTADAAPEARFYSVEVHAGDCPEGDSPVAAALRLVPEGHGVVLVENPDAHPRPAAVDQPGVHTPRPVRVWVDRRPPLGRAP